LVLTQNVLSENNFNEIIFQKKKNKKNWSSKAKNGWQFLTTSSGGQANHFPKLNSVLIKLKNIFVLTIIFDRPKYKRTQTNKKSQKIFSPKHTEPKRFSRPKKQLLILYLYMTCMIWVEVVTKQLMKRNSYQWANKRLINLWLHHTHD
jgi:hypothetical protein